MCLIVYPNLARYEINEAVYKTSIPALWSLYPRGQWEIIPDTKQRREVFRCWFTNKAIEKIRQETGTGNLILFIHGPCMMLDINPWEQRCIFCVLYTIIYRKIYYIQAILETSSGENMTISGRGWTYKCLIYGLKYKVLAKAHKPCPLYLLFLVCFPSSGYHFPFLSPSLDLPSISVNLSLMGIQASGTELQEISVVCFPPLLGNHH